MLSRSLALCTSLLLASCGTESLVDVVSVPPGARIWVEGVDTGKTTPALIDLESWAPDPDRPMQIELRREGCVPTFSVPYPKRHQCGPWPCEHKRRQHLACRLALFESGTGIRVETHYDAPYEVSIDGGDWTPIDGPSLWPQDSAGRTFALAPGPHELRYRATTVKARRSLGGGKVKLVVPKRGYVALTLRWSPL